jgi:N-acetyl-gamma-glutamyl-phosphate reductase
MRPGADAKSANKTLFIDGESGTTGLEIRERLARVRGVTFRSIATKQKKDPAARKEMMAAVDLVVLCLPDDAAREAITIVDEIGEGAPRILDASTAHRTAEGWVYGFAELEKDQSAAIASAKRVANPGCYATGAIALIRPLVDAGIFPADYPLTINAVSGYSGGGRTMIEDYVAKKAPAFDLYALGLEHKHLPEIERYGKITRRPLFVPSVGNFRQGMLVSIPLFLDALPGKPKAADIEAALARHYADARQVKVVLDKPQGPREGRLDAEGLNGTDSMEIFVYANEAQRQAVLVSRLDNLGKGAAGAAVENIKLMLNLAG